MTIVYVVCAIAVLAILAAFRFFNNKNPETLFTWFFSNQEEKVELSKNHLYNVNGYVVHSDSDIFLGSTGSFQRFESVDRSAHESESIFGQSTTGAPHWSGDTDIPPQPLRPAPQPLTLLERTKYQKTISNRDFFCSTYRSSPLGSAPLKSIPRPIPKKQLSAPVSTCSPLIWPPAEVLNRDHQQSKNPFRNESTENILRANSSSKFSSPDNEQVSNTTLSATNPFISDIVGQKSVFDFNPKTVKSIIDQISDEGYLGDSDERDDPFEQIGEESQKVDTNIMFECFDISRKQNYNSKAVKDIEPPANDILVESAIVGEKMTRRARNRFFSESAACDLEEFVLESKIDLENQASAISSPSVESPFLNGKRLLKAPSETYLEQYSSMRTRNQEQLSSELMKNSSSLMKISSQIDNVSSSTLKRTESTDSLSSESPVKIKALERAAPPITGKLCVAIRCDKNNAVTDACDIQVTVLEAKDLVAPPECNLESIDTFVRVYLIPDESTAMQTKTFRNSKQPSYQEMFRFSLKNKNVKRSLWFHLYLTNSACTTLIGETEMKLADFRKPITTWLQLSDSRNNSTNCGDLMFSLSYLPTAERLTVVVVKARNLILSSNEMEKNQLRVNGVYVKVYLLNNGHKLYRKTTTLKREEISIVFNEAIIFSVPPHLLNSLQVKLTVMTSRYNSVTIENGQKPHPIGHVIIGNRTDGKGLLHWHQMISSLRRPVAMFHPIRKIFKKKEQENVMNCV